VATGGPVRHVFVIVLENESSSSTFGSPADDPYLATTLPAEGALLPNYYAVGHVSLDNYIAMISGQPPNPDTSIDCFAGYATFPAGAGQETWHGASGVQTGRGCLYPPAVTTLANELAAKGFTWKAYMEDMGANPARDQTPTSVCAHPTPGAKDPTQVASRGDGYANRHDPFVYFDAVIDAPATCAHVVPLGTPTGAMPASDTVGATGLATDLRSIATTPNFSWITPNLCDDGHDYPCENEPSPAGSAVADIDQFLRTWVPMITSSPAFMKDGLLEITFDEGADSDLSSCCNEVAGPAASGTNGGGRVGAILLSPFIKPGTVLSAAYNHYSSLASIEDIFGLPRLGDAQTVSTTFTAAVQPRSG
jgi:hypothetical protein